MSAPLSMEARWYAGDLHAHSRESGDAKPTIDELVTFARSQGLDFVELSDHNTVSQLDFIDAAGNSVRGQLATRFRRTRESGGRQGTGREGSSPQRPSAASTRMGP